MNTILIGMLICTALALAWNVICVYTFIDMEKQISRKFTIPEVAKSAQGMVVISFVGNLITALLLVIIIWGCQ